MTPAELRALGPLQPGAPQPVVEVRGRVVRVTGNAFHLEHDGSGVPVAWAPPPPFGAWVAVRGRFTGQQVEATAVELLAAPAGDVTRASSDFSWGHAGGIAMLHGRHRALRALRAFFDGRGFLEVETPTVVRSPGLELHLEALEVVGLGDHRWLQTSPEYHMKRLLSAGTARCYQLCKAYRRDEHGTLHQPEFTLLEWYRAFAGSEQLMADTEQLVAELARALHGDTAIRGRAAPIDVAPPWERLPLAEAFARHASRTLEQALQDESTFYRVLVEEVEPALGRGRPLFLTHYPASQAALARLHPEDPRYADRFEAYVEGVELCNGFGELTDPVEQRRRFERDLAARAQQQRARYPIDERFLDALADGLPPCAGNALGLDRLLMLLLGAETIGDVVAFSSERT